MIKNFVIKLRGSDFFSMLFHTVNYCLKNELRDCETVLDIGCGPCSPIKLCKTINYSVGVEPFKPYLNQSRRKKIHSKYVNKKIELIDFKEKSFDAVLLIEVLEHMKKKDGVKLLKKAELWAKKKIIITTPNGYFPMGEIDNNLYHKHLSGWSVSDLKTIGFDVRGITGAKFMYKKENSVDNLGNEEFTFVNMKYKPQHISFLFNAFLQLFTYYIPTSAFELFAVKNLN